ncbi:LamG domain-containing protein, partial [Corallibacter vietnamensis]
MRILNVILFFLPFNLFAQSLSDGLLLHYEFDGDTEDSSTNTNHAVNFGATFVNDRFGNTNAAIHFDGVDDYINFPNISQLKPDLPVSFSFWIKYESYNINDREVFNTSFEEDRNTGVFFNSQASTGNYAVNFGDGSYSYVSSTRRSYVSNSAIDVGNWHQIVIVVTSANNMEIYFDCNESGGGYSGSGGSLQYSDLPGCIGRHDRALGVSANYFKGAIDDFRYWDRALTAENIAELLSSTLISSVAYIDPTDCGLDDGTIIISDLNLNANYTITYEYMGSGFTHSMQSDGSGGIVIVDLPEGIYEDIVIMDDSTGCSSSLGDIELTSPTLDATLSSIDPTDCDADDGSIIISGLLTNTEYTISYNDGSSQTETLFSDSNGEVILTDLASGLYQSISIEEVTTGCIDDLGQVMLIAPELNSEITWTDPTDCGLDDGTIIISDLNLNANYTITYEYMGSGFTHSMQSDGS